MRHRQQVLLGNSEPSMTLLFEALLGRRAPHAAFTVAARLDQLTQHATRAAFDAAIVILDNVAVPTNSPAARIDALLDALPLAPGPGRHAGDRDVGPLPRHRVHRASP